MAIAHCSVFGFKESIVQYGILITERCRILDDAAQLSKASKPNSVKPYSEWVKEGNTSCIRMFGASNSDIANI